MPKLDAQTFLMRWLIAILGVWAVSLSSEATSLVQNYFSIQVRDSQTGRGVPLVKLRASNQDYYTCSNGYFAYNTPGLMNQNVAFFVSSDGYGYNTLPPRTTPGTSGQTAIDRIHHAERLYRVAGNVIFQDTVLLGQSAPIDHPLINANVKGQDSVQSVIYKGKIYWFWGDTRDDVGFGNFRTSGATFGDTANLLTPAFAIPEPSATLLVFVAAGTIWMTEKSRRC